MFWFPLFTRFLDVRISDSSLYEYIYVFLNFYKFLFERLVKDPLDRVHWTENYYMTVEGSFENSPFNRWYLNWYFFYKREELSDSF